MTENSPKVMKDLYPRKPHIQETQMWININIYFKIVHNQTSENQLQNKNIDGKKMQYIQTECASGSVLSDCSLPHGLQPARLFCPWDSPGKNTGVGCLCLLQGIFPTQGSNPGLHCSQILHHLSYMEGHRELHSEEQMKSL